MRCAVSVLLLACAVTLPAQETLRQLRSETRAVAPGIQREVSVDRQGNRSVTYESVLITPREFEGSLVVLEPETGISGPLSLRRSQLVGSRAALALAPARSAVVATWGRMLQWPATGPLLIVAADGSIALDEPNTGVLRLALGGAEREFSIGPEDLGRVRVIPGPLDNEVVDDLVQDRARALIVPFSGDWADPIAGDVETATAIPLERSLRDVAWNEALILLGADDAPVADPVGVTWRVELPAEVLTAQLVVRAGEWLLRDGKAVSSRAAELRPDAATAVAVGTDGRLRMVAAVRDFTAQSGVLRGTFADYLAEAGASDAALVRFGDAGVLMDTADSALWARRESLEAHTLLAVSPRPPEPVLADGTRWRRAEVGNVRVEGRGFAAHPAQGAVDRRVTAADGVAAYAAFSALDAGPPPALVFRLNRPARVAAVDIVHAPAAGFSEELALAEAILLGQTAEDSPWVELASIANASPQFRQRLRIDAPITVRDLRLVVLTPNFVPGGDVARIVEFTIWEELERAR